MKGLPVLGGWAGGVVDTAVPWWMPRPPRYPFYRASHPPRHPTVAERLCHYTRPRVYRLLWR